MISLVEALDTMNNKDTRGVPIPFDVKFTSYDPKKNEYGRVIIANGVMIKHRRSKINKKNRTLNLHFPNGEVRSCHIPLITHFNNQRVS